MAVGCVTQCSVFCFDFKTANIVVDAEVTDAACGLTSAYITCSL